MGRLLADTRYEARCLVRRPGWMLSAVLLLAIGIGANTAIFAAVYKLILRPLPYENADRMVYVWRVPQDGSSSMMIVPTAALVDGFREQARSLEWVEGYQGFTFTVLDGPEPTLADGARVSPALFGALGVRPLLGRPFRRSDVEPGAEPVAILSYGLWQRLYGGDPDIVDRVIRFEEGTRTVVGVMQPDFAFLAPDAESELWVPLSPEGSRPGMGVLTVALLREGVSIERAQAELERVSAGLAEVDPGLAGWKPRLVRPNEMSSEDLRTAIIVLQGAVALVLLIAAGNVANLLLARGLRRRQELTIRAALGAGRGRLARQLLIQGLILGSIGGVLGLLVALWGIELIQWLRPESLELLDSLALQPGVLAFVAALTVVTGLGVGLVPAFRSTRVELAETLKQSGRVSSDAGQEWIRGALVGGQMAFCLLLLVGAGLLLRSFLHLAHRDPGFDPEGLLSVTVDLPSERYPTLADRAAFFDRLLELVSADPRVEIATVAAGLPPETGIMVGKMEIEGAEKVEVPGSAVHALVRAGSNYFRALRIPVIAGRAFDEGDREESEPVVMIGERMAKEYFRGSEMVGQRIRFGGDTWYRIVGVAGDVRQQGLRSESQQLYFPARQSRLGADAVVLRTSEDPSALAGAVKAAVHSVDPRLPIRRISTAKELLAGSIARDRFLAALLAALSLTALALALIGVYGMVSYGVEQRAREIGIRVAVGASRGDVVRFIFGRGVWPVAAGLSLGLVGSLLGAQALRSLLYGVGPTDPVSLALSTTILGLAVLMAHLYPVRRAVRLDPMAVLREE